MSCRLALRMPYLAPLTDGGTGGDCGSDSEGITAKSDEVRAAMKGSAELEDSVVTELADRVNKTLFF
jgi:hypothetical protein